MVKLASHVIQRPDEFQRCFKQGKTIKNRLVVVHVFHRGDSQAPRVGFSVSRRVGNAVVRNRVKRWLKEAVRPLIADLPPGVDIVFSARVRAKDEGFWSLHDALRESLAKAGLIS